MSFFVVERGAADGLLRVPVPRVFDTREAALEALSSAVATGETIIDGEVFVVDLGSAVPVLVMPAPVPQRTDQEPVQDDEPAVTDTAAGAPVYDAWAEAVISSEESADDGLASALKRAADSLEAEGIVAPASIDAGPSVAADAWSTGAPTSVAEPAGESAGVADDDDVQAVAPLVAGSEAMADLSAALEGLRSTELPGAAEPGEQSSPGETGTTDGAWPWTNVAPVVESEDAAIDVDETRDLVAETVASLDADSAADVSMLTPLAEGDDAYLPRPVILGDYDEDRPPAVAEVPDAAPAPTDEALEYVPASLETVPDEDEDLPADQPLEAPAGVWLEPPTQADGPDAASSEDAAPGYEGGAELDLGTYTCEDCVYSNTCPKVGQATPADCGSFQWRSE